MEYKKETLNNGVRLITVPMPNLESVTVMIGVGVGSRYEEAGVQGLAHFTEHMMFKGTDKRPTAHDISSELDALGTHFNASTSKEMTDYYVRAAAKNLPQITEALTDIVFHSKFDPGEIDKEKGVIIEELRMYRDDPKDWVEHVFDALVFGDHPLGWDTLGTEQTLQAIGRDDFLDYLRKWYRGKNIVIAVAGKVGEKETAAVVRSVLGEISNEDAGKPLVYEIKQTEAQLALEERKIDQTQLILGLRAYRREHPNRQKLQVLTRILGGGASSRLFEAIREQRGLAYYVSAGWNKRADTGTVEISAGVNSAKVEEAIQAILAELKRLKEEVVPQAELQKAKEMFRGDMVLGLESTKGVCGYFLDKAILREKIETPEEKLKKIDAVTAEDVREVAQELFVESGLNLALIGPFSDPEKFRLLLSL